MITFDKIKLVADITAVERFDETRFEKTEKDGKCTYRYYQETPFLLVIKVDYREKEVVIEFTGKILGADYPKLISLDSINRCFQLINSMGLITLDIDSMMDADVVKCDVTKDIKCGDIPRLTDYITNHISSYRRYVCRKLRNNNLVIEKNVVTRKTKKRMTIYDKGKEMQKAENRRFVEANGLQGVFDGTCRFELNLNNMEQIRNALETKNTKLRTVLTSKANPIVNFLDEVIDSDVDTPGISTDKKTYLNMLVLKDCDYDLEKVEAKMRQFISSRGTSIKNAMKPYRQMMEKLNDPEQKERWSNIRRQLLG